MYFIINVECGETEKRGVLDCEKSYSACFSCPKHKVTHYQNAPDCFEPKNMTAVEKTETPQCNCGAVTQHGQRTKLQGVRIY